MAEGDGGGMLKGLDALQGLFSGVFLTENAPDLDTLPRLEEVQVAYMMCILVRTEFNLRHAAEILDVSRSTLYLRVKKYGITIDPDRPKKSRPRKVRKKLVA